MLQSMGLVILMVSTLAGLAIFTPLLLLHAARVYVIVLGYSATGEDRFRWPRDGITDWVVQGLPVLGVLLFWGSLGAMIVGPLALALPGLWVFGLWLVFLYLVVPLSLNGVLSAPSQLLLIYPPTIGRLLRQTAGLAYVYVLPLPLFVALGVAVFFLLRSNLWAVTLVAIALPPALLLHARAWGRLVWLALNHDRPRIGKKKRRPADEDAPSPPEPLPQGAFAAERPRSGDDAAYGLEAENDNAPTELVAHYDRQRRREKERRRRAGEPIIDPLGISAPPTLATALGQRILPYLFYEETLLAALGLALTTAAEAGLILMLMQILLGA